MNLSDTFYVALCMTVLILGVVYWFWTQNQYIQRKLNLLENIVYEMKTTLNSGVVPDPIGEGNKGPDLVAPQSYPPPPGSELGEDEDLLHEELHTDAEQASENEKTVMFAMPEESSVSEDNGIKPMDADDGLHAEDALQPGGVGSGIKEVPSDSSSKAGVLEGMTRPQLKRLAEQKGITTKPTMSKQALIDAIRAIPSSSMSPFESHEATTLSLN